MGNFWLCLYEKESLTVAHLGFSWGMGGFLELGHNFYFFQVNNDKLKAHVAVLDLRGLKFYIIFNGTTIYVLFYKHSVFQIEAQKCLSFSQI